MFCERETDLLGFFGKFLCIQKTVENRVSTAFYFTNTKRYLCTLFFYKFKSIPIPKV